MCTSDDPDFCQDAADEPQITPATAMVSRVAKPDLGRRTFLKAAALGTAAAALARTGSGGFGFGPLSALAGDLSTFQCTAGDVIITGVGQIINEDCDCDGNFTATVEFPVRNNASSARTCITLHLVPVTLSDGTVFAPDDVLLQGTLGPKEDGTLTGTIANYPCGAGLVCFGSAEGDGRRRCDPGQCSTISWRVPGQDPDCTVEVKQISSKCRHQRICIQGRGDVTLDCDTGTAGEQSTCEVPCGGFTTLRLSTTGGPEPYTFVLRQGAVDGPVVASTTTSNTSVDFEDVGPITADTTFYGTVTDAEGCTKSDSVTLETTELTVDLVVEGQDNCNGILTITTSVPDGFSGCTFAYTVDGVAAEDVENNDTTVVRVSDDGTTLTYRNLDNTCHTIGVTATCGNCEGSASEAIAQSCVATDNASGVCA